MESDNNEELDADDGEEINVDEWLYALLAMTGDKDRKAELIRKMSENTGQTPEQLEIIIAATINFLANRTRSN
jgi:hypothetical protein